MTDDHAGNAIRTTARYKCLQRIAYFQPHTQPHTRTHMISMCAYSGCQDFSDCSSSKAVGPGSISLKAAPVEAAAVSKVALWVWVQWPYCWWLEFASWGGLAEKGASTFIEHRILIFHNLPEWSEFRHVFEAWMTVATYTCPIARMPIIQTIAPLLELDLFLEAKPLTYVLYVTHLHMVHLYQSSRVFTKKDVNHWRQNPCARKNLDLKICCAKEQQNRGAIAQMVLRWSQVSFFFLRKASVWK